MNVVADVVELKSKRVVDIFVGLVISVVRMYRGLFKWCS